MKYRVIVKVGYHTALFEFDDMTEAGEFAKAILTHQVPNEDTSYKTSISMQILQDGDTEEEDEE